jgi:hypothetical protein
VAWVVSPQGEDIRREAEAFPRAREARTYTRASFDRIMFRHKSADTAGILSVLLRIRNGDERPRDGAPRGSAPAPLVVVFPREMVYPAMHFMGLNR